MLPNFIVVGAPKAGTTSLYHYLSGHSSVYFSSPKEVNYFSSGDILSQELFYSDFVAPDLFTYESLFDGVTKETAVGEASVSYLYYPGVAERIKACIPKAQVIMVLRDPVERGYSHYLMDFKLGLVKLPYEDIVFKRGNNKNLDLYYQQYVELGLYADQVQRYFNNFPLSQIKIYTFDELKIDTSQVVSDLCCFLGVDENLSVGEGEKHNVYSVARNKIIQRLYGLTFLRGFMSGLLPYAFRESIKGVLFKRERKPELSSVVRNALVDIYKPDLLRLNNMIEQDVSHWCQK